MIQKCTILILFSFISITCFAYSLEDGITLFNQGVSLYQEGEYSNAYDSLNRSILIFSIEEIEADEWLMNSYLWIGAASFNLGKYNEAEKFYLKSLGIAELSNNIAYQSNITSALANLKYSLSDFSIAGDWYMKSSKLLETLGYHTEASRALEYGGYCKILSEEYREAYNVYDKVLQNSTGRPDNEIAGIYAMLGNSLYYLQDLNGALKDYQQAVTLIEPFGPTQGLSQFYGWIGKIYFDSSQNDDALEYFQKSLTIAKELNLMEDESRVLAYFGFLYASIGEYEKGAEYYEKSLKIAKALGKIEFLIAAYESLAWIYEENGNEENHIIINKKLIELFEQSNNELKLAEVSNDLGYLLYNQKSYNESIPLFETSLNIYRAYTNHEELAAVLLNLGMAYEKVGEKDLSALYLGESININLEKGDITGAEDLLGHFNLLYSENSDYSSLISSLKRFIPVYKTENSQRKLMYLTNNIGAIYYKISDYNNAIKYYSDAQELAIKLEDFNEQCITLHNIAQSKAALTYFDEALVLNEQALNIAKRNGLITIQANLWNSLGELYRAWGWFEKSLSCYSNSEEIFKQSEDKEGLASVNNNIGQALRVSGKPADSIPYYNKALILNSEIGDEESKAIFLSNLGEAYRELGESEKALSYYSKALQIDIANKNMRGIHVRKNNIALLNTMSGDNIEAIDTFKEGLKFWRKIGNRREEATALKNLWKVNFNMGEYRTAADYLVEVVRIQEVLRLTAKGSVRREYLESQVITYRELAATYYYLEDPQSSLYYMELSRGKYLLEQMNITNDRNVYDWSTYYKFINNMERDAALISYSLVDKNLFQAVSIQNGIITTTLINIEQEFIDYIYSQFGSLLSRYVENSDKNKFESILKFYRILLSRPVLSRSTKQAVDIIGKHLYSKLIFPFSKQLENTDKLIIIPDGILGTIPFEVLQEKSGGYLIEKYDISYSQSLVISQMIREREYIHKRLPLLAFGGAVYEHDTNFEVTGDSDVNVIREDVLEMIRTGKSTRGAYTRMGIGSWANLPGTLDEVNLLSQIVPGSKIVTGSNVTEETVLDISNSGDLANYKVIHFATHGIVVPEIPEMSAIVLSQFSNEQGYEDGYLTMSEISSLDIKADFVNLSACETGLGKIYQGEGVVGLTQAFLIAGANALSVSLWQVSDESTMKFMTGVYSLVEEQGLSYSGAISEMKRIFLKDNKYKSPFYWAPFVLYGNYEAGL